MSEEPKTSAERFNEISRLNKWGLSYCPPGETMSVDAPKCPSGAAKEMCEKILELKDSN